MNNNWNNIFENLKEYLKENDGQYPKFNEYYRGIALGHWVNKQRVIYNNGEKSEDGSIKYKNYLLKKEQIDKLNLINFVWSSTIYEEKWEENFELLKKFLEEHNGKYSKLTDNYMGDSLRNWVYIQRKVYNNGELKEDGSIRYYSNILTQERIDKLNEINFKWKYSDELWDESYNFLKEYLENNKGQYPKQNEIYKNKKIGNWVSKQRMIYNNGKREEDGSIRYKTNILTNERIEKLNEISFKWKMEIIDVTDNLWEDNYNLLQEYLEEYNGKYPQKYDEYKGALLGLWIIRQRLIYNKGKHLENGSIIYDNHVLTKERIDKLNEINFLWKSDHIDFSWNEKYELLKEYINKYRVYPKAMTIYKGINIGKWVSRQRNIYNNGIKEEDRSVRYQTQILTRRQIDMLNEIAFIWKAPKKHKLSSKEKSDIKWNKKYELLKEYLVKYNGYYPKKHFYYKDEDIFIWIQIQRMIYNQGEKFDDGSIKFKQYTLTKEKIDKLNEIDFKWIEYMPFDYERRFTDETKKLMKKKLLYLFKQILNYQKNEIESKEDIKQIEKEFVKSLTIFK